MTPNELVAREAERILKPGEMGNIGPRGAEYERWLDEAYGDGKSIRKVATSCAVFVGGCLIHSGVQAKRKRPAKPGITTWVGMSFSGSAWMRNPSELRRGDIPYWCSDAGSLTVNGKTYTWSKWQDALNGHVGILTAGAGDMWIVAEGGGSPGGTMCRLSSAAKNVRKLDRKLQGVWRPDELRAETTWREIKPGMKGEDVRAWQLSLLQWQSTCLPKWGADGVYGTKLDSETLLATRAFQKARGLPETGVVDRLTWDAAAV